MSMNKEFTYELAMKILDGKIRKCETALRKLENGTEDYDATFVELRMYEMHRDQLMNKGQCKA